MESSLLIQKSAEYLRAAVPLMVKHKIPMTPVNYAVWYAFVSGSNPDLSSAINGTLESGEEINDVLTAGLFSTYMSTIDRQEFDRSQEKLLHLLADVVLNLDNVSGEATRYVEKLANYSTQLSGSSSATQVSDILMALTANTRQILDVSGELRRNLDGTKREAEILRVELVKAKLEASTDSLTGLANRRAFDEKISQIAQAGCSDVSTHFLLLGDIDKFKKINDEYGHVVGDTVINTVATVIKSAISPRAMAARIGGEEFAILLPETLVADAIGVAQDIRHRIEHRRILNRRQGDQGTQVTISIGVTQIRQGELAVDTIARCDRALYKAKELGRNRVEIQLP